MPDRNSPPLQPEILQKFQEILPEHWDLTEYLQAIASNNIGSPAHYPSSSTLQISRVDLEQVQLDEVIISSFLDSQRTSLASWSTLEPGTEQNSHYSWNNSLDLELEAAIAFSLEDPGAETSIGLSESQEATSSEPSALVAAQGDIDPEDMTYEQRRSLEESVGTESRGLSKELLDSFPIQKLRRKSGWFSSRKRDAEGCPICVTEYEIGSELLTLPCLHMYHTSCIAEWLKDNKTCPVCTMDISETQT